MLKLEYDEFGYVATAMRGTFLELVEQAFNLLVALFDRMGNDGKAGATLLVSALIQHFNIDREAIEWTNDGEEE